jgi:hypothetical protein
MDNAERWEVRLLNMQHDHIAINNSIFFVIYFVISFASFPTIANMKPAKSDCD